MKRIFISLILITQPVFAYYTETIPNQCGVIGNDLHAIFEINTYTCQSGQFLPADTLGCVQCPNGYACNGGTYDFNENEYQGAVKSSGYITHNLTNMCGTNAPHELFAVFTPNQYTCSAGYYLPANIDECTICPNDNYCAGGTYTFSETQTQGITPCPSAHPFAPAGMWLLSQCGRKLHVGDDIIYLHQSPAVPTTHRLFVQYGNTTYSANAVPKSENNIPMSDGAAHSLHIIIDNIEYLVHDDSVTN